MSQLLVDRNPVGETDRAVQVRGPVPTMTAARPAPASPRPTRRVRPRRSGRGSGRAAAPNLRPAVFWAAPTTARRPIPAARSCTPVAPALEVAVGSATGWRLTDRGVAVVLVVGLMIMVAALTVVGLTAMSVTGDGYQATVSAGLPR